MYPRVLLYTVCKLVVYSFQVFMMARTSIRIFWTIISYTITNGYICSK